MQIASRPSGMHVAEILDREGGVAVVLGRARRQIFLAESPALLDQLGLEIGEAERIRRE